VGRIRIAGAALNQTPFDWQGNTSNIIAAIAEAQSLGARILCLPELCITGYGCEDTFLSDWLSARAMHELLRLRDFTSDITVNVGLPVRMNSITYNGSCVISDRKILGITLKQNLAKEGVHYEPRWFEPWKPGMTVRLPVGDSVVEAGDLLYEAEGVRFGIEICEDGWSKMNRPGYRFAKQGARLILNPSASHFAMGKSSNREQEVAIDGSSKFSCVYLFANHLGNEAGRMIYDGDILIAQKGKLLAQNTRLSFKPVNVLACDVDFDQPDNSIAQRLPDSKDRNEELTRALTLGLYDYLRKSRNNGFVLSLSGGADSATCATMVAEMVRRGSQELGWTEFWRRLGIETQATDQKQAVAQLLTCAYQATDNSSAKTLSAARQLAESIGAVFYQWSVQDEVDTYTSKIEKAIGHQTDWEQHDIAMQNIQARARSPIIWMLANLKQSILLTTSNRSEGDVGYTTMDGDTSGSLAPISGINKTTIIEWLRWAEHELGYAGLADVNNLKPTAELRPADKHQTDEDDLMPYATLAEIERHAILHRKSPIEVFHSMMGTHTNHAELKKQIRKFFRLWAANQWKRERLAPSFHLDELNVDPRTWCRFPILSSGFSQELQELDAYVP
jgi:NAD+ synthase (glutamine-hydrolysing)